MKYHSLFDIRDERRGPASQGSPDVQHNIFHLERKTCLASGAMTQPPISMLLKYLVVGCLAVIGIYASAANITAGAAQSDATGEIVGVVTDQNGAVVPDAQVTVVQISTGFQRQVMTNQDGFSPYGFCRRAGTRLK
jgi:hypothetical protein